MGVFGLPLLLRLRLSLRLKHSPQFWIHAGYLVLKRALSAALDPLGFQISTAELDVLFEFVGVHEGSFAIAPIRICAHVGQYGPCVPLASQI